MTSNIWNISDMHKVCEIRANNPSASLLETFARNWPFILTIKQRNDRNIFWRTEMKVQNYRDKSATRFLKLVVFSISSKNFIIELVQWNSYQFCLASFSDSEILCFFPLIYFGNNLSVNVLKSLCQDILLCKW